MHPFDDIDEKLGRANEHIHQLNTEINRFIDEAPNPRIINYQPDEGEAFRRFHQSRIVPRRFSVIAGEVIYQLRSSLDHAVCIFVTRAGGTPTIQTQFPIFSHRPVKRDEVARYERQIQPIDPAGPIGTIIEKVQPYNRSNRNDFALTILKTLNNADKHRALALHVVTVRPEVRLTFRPETAEDAVFDSSDTGTEHTLLGKTLDGYEIVNVQRQLTTDIAFDQFGSIKEHRVISALLFLRGYVTGLLKRLRSEIN